MAIRLITKLSSLKQARAVRLSSLWVGSLLVILSVLSLRHASTTQDSWLEESRETIAGNQVNTANNSFQAAVPAGPSTIDSNTAVGTPTTTTVTRANLQLPVIVTSLAKSGTTTMHKYFKCGNYKSKHKHVRGGTIGRCIRNNVNASRPALQGCGPGKNGIFSDLVDDCYEPSVWALEDIYRSYPNAPLVLGTRNSYEWIDSVDRFRFQKWALMNHWSKCRNRLWPVYDETDHGDMTKDDIRQFYLWHQNHVRTFAKNHPSMAFIEVDISASDTGAALETATGINATCWGQHNVNLGNGKFN